mgnify:CR=1 FL=1
MLFDYNVNEPALIAEWKKENNKRLSRGLQGISYLEFKRRKELADSFYKTNTEGAGLGTDNLRALYAKDITNRFAHNQVPITYGEFVREVQNAPKPEEEVGDFRPDYAKPILDRYDPESDEYAQWKDTMDTWEAEDATRAEADVLMNQLVQKHLNSFNEANKKAKYDRLIKNFSSKYRQDVDTTPIETKYFI